MRIARCAALLLVVVCGCAPTRLQTPAPVTATVSLTTTPTAILTPTVFPTLTPPPTPTDTPPNASPLLNRFTTSEPILTWVPVGWAQGFELQVAHDTAFTREAHRNSAIGGSASAAALTPALADGVYYWRVRARVSETLWTDWSSVGQFTIAT